MRPAVVDFEELVRKCVTTLQAGELADPLILSIRGVTGDLACMTDACHEQVEAAMRRDSKTLCDVVEKEWREFTLARETVSSGVFRDHDGWRSYLAIADQHNGLYVTRRSQYDCEDAVRHPETLTRDAVIRNGREKPSGLSPLLERIEDPHAFPVRFVFFDVGNVTLVSLVDIVSCLVFEHDVQGDAEIMIVDRPVESLADDPDRKVKRAVVTGQEVLRRSNQVLPGLIGIIDEVEKHNVSDWCICRHAALLWLIVNVDWGW